jgi:hypothetical protein
MAAKAETPAAQRNYLRMVRMCACLALACAPRPHAGGPAHAWRRREARLVANEYRAFEKRTVEPLFWRVENFPTLATSPSCAGRFSIATRSNPT